MHATDIDLSRTKAEGARLLREYLDYAEHGDVALERSISVNPFEQFDSEFEMDVCDFLREHGFTVDTQVGCSGFRIDLGLKKPNSSDYVLAIECDGATYHYSKNARDRDRLRQEILERMGWNFYRIWSTDWFRNTAVEKERLLEACQKAIHLGRNVKPAEPEKTEEETPVVFEKTIAPKHLAFPEYHDANIYEVRRGHSTVQSFVKAIMQVEAPVSEEYLLKQICYIYGREKVTSVVKQQFAADMRGCDRMGIIRRNGYLYLSEQNKYVLRVPGVKRDIKYIAPEELAAGLNTILKQNYSADKDGLYRTLVNQLGFSRIGDAIYAKLDESLSLLRNIEIDGDLVILKQE
jgi:very-short-patch-repair endonuclease